MKSMSHPQDNACLLSLSTLCRQLDDHVLAKIGCGRVGDEGVE